MLEVVGIKGIVHLGQIQSGMSGAIRLAQGGRVILSASNNNNNDKNTFVDVCMFAR
jgi:hypothetical protein